MTRRLPGVLRTVLLALVLALVGLTVPDSAVRPAEVSLVKLPRAQGVDGGRGVTWILAIGSDARPGQTMTRTRADAIQLVGLNPGTGAASAIGIPRDAWVPIPGHGSNRINAALTFGGPELMGRAVANLVGIRPDYVMVTRFRFFESMIESIGGIYVDNPRPFDDSSLKPKGFRKGHIKLDGYGAMAFSRIRKSLAGGDFDRSANQQRVLRGIQARIATRASQPGFIETGVRSVMRNMDTDLGPAELFRLAHVVAQVDPRKVTTCVVRGSFGNVGGASIIRPNVAQARRYGNAARNDARLGRC